MGDALADDLIEDLHHAIRQRVGSPADQLPHTCDYLVDRICVWWPVRWMSYLAHQPADQEVAGEALDALAVISAKVQEDLEARWGVTKANTAAIRSLLHPCAIEAANIWFTGREQRMLMRRVCWRLRHG